MVHAIVDLALMRNGIVWFIIVLLIVIGMVLYRSRSRSHLDVTPDAWRALEKAKRR